MTTLYIYCLEDNILVAKISGNEADCLKKADEVFGPNDHEWTYKQKDELEYDGDCQEIEA